MYNIACHLCLLILIFCLYGLAFSSSLHLSLSTHEIRGIEGSSVNVNCKANVTSKSLKWVVQQGQKFQESPGYDGSVTLTIPHLHRNDAGTYTCLLITDEGQEEKEELRIFVKSKNRDTRTCKATQFKCKETKHCIFLRYRCDGKDDCGDGSDEECPGNPCANKFLCNNTRCVDVDLQCDHVDHCGDNSDESERACISLRVRGGDKTASTADPNKVNNDEGGEDNYSWVKSTIYTIIASTIGLVILISFVVILVFRAKMKRIRERRMVRALNTMQIYGGADDRRLPLPGDDGSSIEHQPFLPRTSQPYHQGPSIIFNVNNGVQYMPRYRCFVDNPPPYSEVQGSGGGETVENTPPPYSTLDRSGDGPQGHPHDRHYEPLHPRNPNFPNVRENPQQGGVNERRRPVADQSLSQSSGPVFSPPQSSNSGYVSGLERNQMVGNVDPSHPSFSYGQGPVTDINRGASGQTSTLIPGGRAEVTAPISNSTNLVNINSNFLQHLLSTTACNSQGPAVDSESYSNESGSSSSSSSSGDDAAVVDGGNSLGTFDGANGVHEAQTLKAREHHPNLPHNTSSFESAPPAAADGQMIQSQQSSLNWQPPLGGVDQIAESNSSAGQEVCELDSLISHPPGASSNNVSDDGSVIRSSLPNSSTEEQPLLVGLENDASSPALSHFPINNAHSDFNQMGSSSVPTNPNNNNNGVVSSDTSSGALADNNASSALFQEVSRRDARNRPKQGHLSVHRGQIVLHTGDGILAGQTLLPTTMDENNSDRGVESATAHLSGEIIVKDGNIMLQIPVGRSLTSGGHVGFPVMDKSAQGRPSPSSPGSRLSQSDMPYIMPNNNSSDNSTSVANTNNSSQNTSIVQVSEVDGKQPTRGPMGGDLNIRDGQLVLEPPRHTPSSQLLAHLQGAYGYEEEEEEQQGDQVATPSERMEEGAATLGPVVNDKRPVNGVGHRQPVAKFNSDIVLPRGKN